MPQPLADQPRDILLDASNDIVITTDLVMAVGIAAVAQSCRIAVQMYLGEWFADLDLGVDWWAILGTKGPRAVALARANFRKELSKVDGVLEVVKLLVDFDNETRTLTVVWQVRTALGNTPVDSIVRRVSGGA